MHKYTLTFEHIALIGCSRQLKRAHCPIHWQTGNQMSDTLWGGSL